MSITIDWYVNAHINYYLFCTANSIILIHFGKNHCAQVFNAQKTFHDPYSKF